MPLRGPRNLRTPLWSTIEKSFRDANTIQPKKFNLGREEWAQSVHKHSRDMAIFVNHSESPHEFAVSEISEVARDSKPHSRIVWVRRTQSHPITIRFGTSEESIVQRSLCANHFSSDGPSNATHLSAYPQQFEVTRNSSSRENPRCPN